MPLRGVQIGSVRHGRFHMAGLVMIVFVVVMRVGRSNMVLILGASLSFASIAFLAEGEIEIIAEEADPILGFVVGAGLGCLARDFLDWGQIVVHLNRNY